LLFSLCNMFSTINRLIIEKKWPINRLTNFWPIPTSKFRNSRMLFFVNVYDTRVDGFHVEKMLSFTFPINTPLCKVRTLKIYPLKKKTHFPDDLHFTINHHSILFYYTIHSCRISRPVSLIVAASFLLYVTLYHYWSNFMLLRCRLLYVTLWNFFLLLLVEFSVAFCIINRLLLSNQIWNVISAKKNSTYISSRLILILMIKKLF